jgi:hypothetical protein
LKFQLPSIVLANGEEYLNIDYISSTPTLDTFDVIQSTSNMINGAPTHFHLNGITKNVDDIKSLHIRRLSLIFHHESQLPLLFIWQQKH